MILKNRNGQFYDNIFIEPYLKIYTPYHQQFGVFINKTSLTYEPNPFLNG